MVQEVVQVGDAEVQQQSSVVFLEILQRHLVPLHSYSDTFLQTILNCVDNKDPGIYLSYEQTYFGYFGEPGTKCISSHATFLTTIFAGFDV